MLGTFPKVFSKRQLPKSIFPSDNFPNVPIFKSDLAAVLGPPSPSQLQCSVHIVACDPSEVAAWKNAKLMMFSQFFSLTVDYFRQKNDDILLIVIQIEF